MHFSVFAAEIVFQYSVFLFLPLHHSAKNRDFQKLSFFACSFPDHPRFCIIAVRRFHVFKYCNLSPRRDPFCFPKSAFIAPVLPILNSFQIPFFSDCSAVFLLVFEIIAFLPCLFSFSKIPLFWFRACRFSNLHFSAFGFSKFIFAAPILLSFFSKCRFPVLVLENCQLSRRDHLEDIVLEKYGKLQSLAAGKTDFCIFGKLKRITRRASAIFRDIGKLSFWFASLEDLQAPIIINILI